MILRCLIRGCRPFTAEWQRSPGTRYLFCSRCLRRIRCDGQARGLLHWYWLVRSKYYREAWRRWRT